MVAILGVCVGTSLSLPLRNKNNRIDVGWNHKDMF